MSELEHIVKSFGSKRVLDDMALDLADSGVTCLLGASGCGKSTVLRIAAGLTEADSGISRIAPEHCGVVFQDPRLIPWLTVEENLALALPPAQRKQGRPQLASVLSQVKLDIEGIGKLMPSELSGGMAQRVGIARALLREPDLLMMDEPFAALDAIPRGKLQNMLRMLVEEKHIRCLFVTHDISEAFTIASRIVVMSEGRTAATYEAAEFADLAQQASIRKTILTLLDKE